MLQIPPEPSLIPQCELCGTSISSPMQKFEVSLWESLRWVYEKVWSESLRKFEVSMQQSLRWICKKVWGKSKAKFEVSLWESLRWVGDKVWGESARKFEVSPWESLRWVCNKVWGESAKGFGESGKKFEVSLVDTQGLSSSCTWKASMFLTVTSIKIPLGWDNVVL